MFLSFFSFFIVFPFSCIPVLCVYVYVSLYVWAHVCEGVCMHLETSLMSGIIILMIHQGRVPQSNPELMDVASLTSQLACSGNPLSPSPGLEWQVGSYTYPTFTRLLGI